MSDPVIDLKNEKLKLGINSAAEKLFVKMFGRTYYAKQLWPTMDSLRRLGDNIYLLDYQYDYDVDDLMKNGAASAVKLLSYASKRILRNGRKFRMGKWGFGCSAYSAKNPDGDCIMGRNFDYLDAPCYIVWTHPEKGYASISTVSGSFMLTTDHLNHSTVGGRLQTLLAPYLCLDGLNEKGLAIAVLQIHADGTMQDTGKTKMFTTAMIRCCLDKCATVEEAIELFSKFDVQDNIANGKSLGCCFHYMLTDANGDAAVIEYVRNEMRVIRAENADDCLRVTNYFLSADGGKDMEAYDPEGMERYDMMTETLVANDGKLTFEQSINLLSDIHLNYRHKNNLYDITTLWSNLYNNTRGTASVAARMDYSKVYTFDVMHPMCVYSVDSVPVTMPIEGIDLR